MTRPNAAPHTYLLQQHHLRDHWADISTNTFLLLTANEQWDLFVYYLPLERLPDDQLIQHRQDISAYDTSLPQRAGRALARLHIMEQRLEPYELHVLGEVHPEIDVQQLAKALLNYERRDVDE